MSQSPEEALPVGGTESEAGPLVDPSVYPDASRQPNSTAIRDNALPIPADVFEASQIKKGSGQAAAVKPMSMGRAMAWFVQGAWFIILAVGAWAFGSTYLNVTPTAESINGTTSTAENYVWFAPSSAPINNMVEMITAAKSEVIVLAETIVAKDVLEALILKHRAGVRVVIIIDDEVNQARSRGVVGWLLARKFNRLFLAPDVKGAIIITDETWSMTANGPITTRLNAGSYSLAVQDTAIAKEFKDKAVAVAKGGKYIE